MTNWRQQVISFAGSRPLCYREGVPKPGPPARAATPAPPVPRDDKAARILEAALSAFARYGFRRASIDDVAREAGVARDVYLYHESKEALFRAVSQAVIDRLLAATEEARRTEGPAPERIRLLLEAKFLYLYDLVFSSPHAAEILDSKGRVSADLFEAADRRYQAHLAAVLAEGVDAGELDLASAGLTPASAAAFLVRCGHGIGSAENAGGLPSREVFRRRIAELARVVLHGLSPR